MYAIRVLWNRYTGKSQSGQGVMLQMPRSMGCMSCIHGHIMSVIDCFMDSYSNAAIGHWDD